MMQLMKRPFSTKVSVQPIIFTGTTSSDFGMPGQKAVIHSVLFGKSECQVLFVSTFSPKSNLLVSAGAYSLVNHCSTEYSL